MDEIPIVKQDSPWKEILVSYFSEFVEFFFPHAFEAIDWSRGYEFLETELQQVVREAEIGSKRVDKLVQVWLKNGEEAWALIHIEVQGQREKPFSERMYIYNYRIYDRYRKPVASLAVLIDTHQKWRPNHFGYELFGCRVSLDFPVIKLLDYQEQWDELERSKNPFAVVVMAQLRMLQTRKNPGERYAAKMNLIKLLYKKGYSRRDIIELLRFIDWIITLPKELGQQFLQEISKYEAEERMPYVTSFERIATERGIEKGLRDGIILNLDVRFGRVPENVLALLEQIEDVDELRQQHRRAITAESLEEFEQGLIVE